MFFDISDPSSPNLIGRLDDGALRVYDYKDGYLFAGDERETRIFDVSDPNNIVVANILDIDEPRNGIDMKIKDSLLFVANVHELYSVDISTLNDPIFLDSIACFNRNSMDIVDQYIYMLTWEYRVAIFDASDPNNLEFVSSIDVPASTIELCAYDSYVYVTVTNGGILVIDVSNPAAPQIIGSLGLGNRYIGLDIIADEHFLYVANYYRGLEVIDITDHENPVLTGYYTTGSRPRGLSLRDNIVYLADYMDGLYIIRNDGSNSITDQYQEQQPAEVVLLSNYPNPFNSSTTIAVLLPTALTQKSELTIFDIYGHKVGVIPILSTSGSHQIVCAAHGLASGQYVLQLNVGRFNQSQKIVLIR